MIKIAFFDVDGTILKVSHKDLSIKTKEALLKLKENGVLLCMATGRCNCALPHFEGFEFDAYLSFNGSFTKCGDVVVRRSPMDRSDVNIIYNNLKNMNRPVSIAGEDFVVKNGVDELLEQYIRFGSGHVDIPKDFNHYYSQEIYQMMCSATKDEYDKILEGTRNADIAAWWDKAIDIIPKNSGKGEAVKVILNYYGITKEEAIAFGDGYNDVPMFNEVKTSVAMANSSDIVKSLATDICDSCDNDGVYYYCLNHGLI